MNGVQVIVGCVLACGVALAQGTCASDTGAVLPGPRPPNVPAQTTGVISGTVRVNAEDHPGVPNAPVVARNTVTGRFYSVRSTASGTYRIPGLPDGPYDVSVNMTDPLPFPPFCQKNLRVRAGQDTRLDIELEDVQLGTIGDSIADFVRSLTPPPPPKGPMPRTPEGKPDLSGLWLGGMSTQISKPELLPEAEALAKERAQDVAHSLPSARCLPMGIGFTGAFGPTRLVQTPKILIVIDEDEPIRQIYLDGRPHPRDWNPSFMGHSIGHWEGDTLVVDTTGLNDKTWISFSVTVHTEMLHLTERYRRIDLGHLEVETVFDDPGAFKKPWTMKRTSSLAPKEGDVLESVCENERDSAHVPK
jgi:Carboxypeptidase regulatory-like domain